MNCFNHPDQAAIGTCKACSKGMCADCAVDLGSGLACKGAHEQRVKDLEMIISSNAKAYRSAPRNMFLMPVFFVFMGLVFAGYSLYNGRPMSHVSVVMGGGFIVFGILNFLVSRKIFVNDKSKS
jgi:hypothetical protein